MSEPTTAVDGTRQAVYACLTRLGLATKRDLARDLGLSLPTVGKYLTLLLADGLIEEKTKLASGSRGGRNPVAYAVRTEARFAVGVDVAAHRVVTVVVDLGGGVRARRRTERRFSRERGYFDFLAEEVGAALDEGGADRGDVLGVGVAVPGLVDEASQQVFYGEAIGNEGLRLEELARGIDLPVHLFHDSDAAGQAEFRQREDLQDAFYLSLSGSIGGAILLGGEIYAGGGLFRGEVGHVLVQPGGRLCYCGRRGCLDPYCNASVLADAAGGDLDAFFARLDDRDPAALDVWEGYVRHLARAIHDVRMLFGGTVILGGDVGPYFSGRLDALLGEVDAWSFRPDPAVAFVHPCVHGDDPIATGAALFLVEEFTRDPGGTSRAPSAGA